MVYVPVLAGALAALFFGLSDFFSVKPSRELSPYLVATYIMSISLMVLLPIMLYAGFATGASGALLLVTLGVEFLLFVGYIFNYRAYRAGDLSIAAPIAATYPAITVILAILLLHDIPSLIQSALIAVVLLGVVLVSINPRSLRSRKWIAAGAGSAIMAAVIYSFTSLFTGAYAIVIGFVLFTFISRAVGAATGFIASRFMKHKLELPKKKGLLKPLVLAGVTDAFGALSWVYGVYVIPSSLPILAAVAGFAGGVAAICAFIALKERPAPTQLLGIALAVLGVVLLSYFTTG